MKTLSYIANFFRWKSKADIQPIFILSPPRSGSTMLFETLWNFREFYHFDHESDPIWWDCFPYEKMKSPSDEIGPEMITQANIRLIKSATRDAILSKYKGDAILSQRSILFLDKTIANCFHLAFLNKAFPNARYIFLVRDPRDNISSMIEGWPFVDRFGKVQLTPLIKNIKGATISHWTYPAPPNWQEVATWPLPEICAWSWQQHVEHVLYFFDKTHKPFIFIKYEDVIKNPMLIYTKIAGELNLDVSNIDARLLQEPPLSSTTVTLPEVDKWKKKHFKEITSIIPIVAGTAHKIGYVLD